MPRVDITPKTGMLLGIQQQDWTVHAAVCEAIDNSFGAARGDAQEVVISWDSRKRELCIVDDGRGMSNPTDLLQLGQTAGRSTKDIGKFGMGGTMMCAWLAEEVYISTLRDGKFNDVRADWASLINRASQDWTVEAGGWRRAHAGNTPMELLERGQGTFIGLTVPDKRHIDPARIQREIERLYAPGLRQGRRVIWESVSHRGTRSRPLAAPALNLQHEQNIDLVLDVVMTARDESGRIIDAVLMPLAVTGVIGYDESATAQDSVVSICYGPRVILRTRECYSAPDGSKSYSGVGVVGWIDLGEGWQDYLTTTKSGIDDDRAKQVLMEHLFKQLEPLLEELEQDRRVVRLDNLRLALAVGLEGAFDIDVLVKREARYHWEKKATGVEVPAIEAKRSDGGQAEGTPISGDESGVPGKAKAKTTIYLDWQPSEKLDHALYRVTLDGHALNVVLNQDHPYVQEAQGRSSPVQEMLLFSLLVPGVVQRILEQDDDFRRDTLTKGVAALIEKMEDENQKLGFLTAHLLKNAVVVG